MTGVNVPPFLHTGQSRNVKIIVLLTMLKNPRNNKIRKQKLIYFLWNSLLFIIQAFSNTTGKI